MKNRNKLTLYLAVIFLSLGCEKEKLGNPFKIVSYKEIENGIQKNRLGEIPNCRVDDEFYFNSDQKGDIIPTGDDCPNDLGRISGFFWNIVTIDSLQGEFLEIDIPGSVALYIIHDSLRLTKTRDQWWNNRENQFYKIIEFSDEKIIIQNSDGVSIPRTQNVWQLEFQKQ